MSNEKFDLVDLLPRMTMFSQLNLQQIEQLAAHCRLRSIGKGEVLFQRGDAAHGFYHVVSGQIKLAFSSQQGNEKIVEIIGPGHSFGEAVMFLDRPYPVFAEALLDSEVVQVSQAAVFRLLDSDPSVARGMLAGLAIRLHALVHDVEAYSLQNSAQRVIGYLLQEAHAGPCAAGSAVIKLAASKQAIASRLNLTPETFSRTLHMFAEEGLIAVEGRSIRLLDLQRLSEHGK